MKTFITLLAAGMITFLSFAQEPNNQNTMVELEDVVVSALNTSYLTSVQDENTPKEVVVLQKQVAQYDVRSNQEFFEEVKNDTFEMVFSNSKGSINTFYDNRGKIASAYERFKDILLPRTIQQQLLRAHKNWTMVGNLYASAYEGDDLIDRSYKIQLQKGDENKSIVIHLNK